MAFRIVVVLLALGALFGGFWLVLPIIRNWLLPTAGGASGALWIIGPPRVLCFGACAGLWAITLPFLLRPLALAWRANDQRANGAPVAPMAVHHVGRLALLIRGGLLFALYAVCGVVYFVSYGEVMDRSITFHSLFGARTYGYEHVVSLEHQASEGGQDPRYAIALDDESWGYFDASCEGLSEADVSAIAAHLSERTGRSWVETYGHR
jgi:hypothetical protein